MSVSVVYLVLAFLNLIIGIVRVSNSDDCIININLIATVLLCTAAICNFI